MDHSHCDRAAQDESNAALPADAPSSMSLHQLESEWTTHDGRPFRFSELREHPTLVVMFYASCAHACPILLEDAERIERALPEQARRELRVVLVTIDPERDDADALAELAATRELDLSRWTLLRGNDDDIRELAFLLGVRYRRTADGNYNHSNLVTLLDRGGEVAMQNEGLYQPAEPMVRRIAELRM